MRFKYISITVSALSILAIVLAMTFASSDTKAEETVYSDLHVCSMHPWNAAEGISDCDICGMKLSKVHNHKPGTKLPKIENLFVSESNAMYIHEGSGKDPDDGAALVNITESPIYEPKEPIEANQMSIEDIHAGHNHEAEDIELWTCGMHPEVISDKPY